MKIRRFQMRLAAAIAGGLVLGSWAVGDDGKPAPKPAPKQLSAKPIPLPKPAKFFPLNRNQPMTLPGAGQKKEQPPRAARGPSSAKSPSPSSAATFKDKVKRFFTWSKS